MVGLVRTMKDETMGLGRSVLLLSGSMSKDSQNLRAVAT